MTSHRTGVVGRVAGAVIVSAALVLVPVVPGLAAAEDGPGRAGSTDSAMTLPGLGDFADLRVTVSKTAELGNESVSVSWSGARPTAPANGSFYADFLQVMQCWGDPGASGPDRDQCQYGASNDGRGGYGTQLRRVFATDLQESFEGRQDFQYSLPVRSVNGTSETPTTATGLQVSYFSRLNTNELPFGRTNPAGQGEVFLEAQTALEAPWMGCGGAVVQGATTSPRRCYLVVVPRGRVDADGIVVVNPGEGPDGRLLSSPLSASNWDDRIVFPLDFTSVDTRCTGNAAETPVVGTEVVSSAFRRWQPVLCGASDARYSYVEVADVIAENSVARGDGELVFTTSAFDDSLLAEGTDVEYAPVSLSGIGVAVLVEQVIGKADEDLTEEDRRQTGTRVQELNLTPRLVAKLLTQSYQAGAWIGAPQVGDNPRDLASDPEFRTLNPGLTTLSFVEPYVLGDALTPASSGGAVETLWRWVMADEQARTWLDGTPDESGMVVNPDYRRLESGLDFFPRRDRNCLQPGPSQPNVPVGIQLCALDLHPYASDLQASARYASRGDLNSATFNTGYLPSQLTPYRNSPLEPALSGRRAVLAVTDTVSAARYQLPMASLRNPAGEFVAPTDTSLTAALGAMRSSAADAQVLEPDAGMEVSGAYAAPLLTYAALVPTDTTAERGDLYADVVEYAVTTGQSPGEQVGQLPRGYTPLPDALRQSAVRAAAAMRAGGGAPSPPSTPPSSGGAQATPAAAPVPVAPTPLPTTSPLGLSDPVLGPPAGLSGADPGLPPLAGAAGPAIAGPVPAATALLDPPVVELATDRTSTTGTYPSAYRWLFIVLVGLGVVAAAAGPTTLAVARRKRSTTG